MQTKRTMLLLFAFLLAACQPGGMFATPESTATPMSNDTATPTATQTPIPTATPDYPAQGYGPHDFPSDVNSLTGQVAANPALLERRPVVIKISNLPRNVRPQWGLTAADIVFEYYTEEGTTRFAAVYLGTDAAQVGPIRSARFFDIYPVRMYKALFAYGSADKRVRNRLNGTEFSDRLILEWQAGCPAMCRFDPNVYDSLVGNTSELSAYATKKGVNNTRQNLDGMFFQMAAPAGGQPVASVFTWYSAAIYNRWDYDPATGKYLRYSEKDNAVSGQPETYELLTDRNNNLPVTTDTLVVLLMSHTFYSRDPEIVEMDFNGSGPAYVFRDGQAYQVKWQAMADTVVSLVNQDGTPFPFKPGRTWFEVMGKTTEFSQMDQAWRFQMRFP